MIDLRAEMSKLPEPPNDSHPPFWPYWQHDLWEHAINDDPENFTTWPCIHHTMLVQFRNMDWRWNELPMRYKKVISDLPSPLFENAIEEGYHLYQWEFVTGKKVEDLTRILEFGGGYGQMAWLCRKLGFRGDYFLVDTPEFELLQQWWLDDQGIEAFYGHPYQDPDLYIAIYSLSVVEPSQRRHKTREADSYLLAYSDHMEDWDNHRWFDQWMATTGKRFTVWQMPDRPEDWYAVC